MQAFPWPSWSRQRSDAFCRPDQLERLCSNRPRNDYIFSHIEPPFLGFIFRHEGLPAPDARGQFNLRDARVLARLDERLEQGPVEIGLR